MLRALQLLPQADDRASCRAPAFGGGVGLVAACDIAIASERRSFCLTEVRLGLMPAVISPYVIARHRPARRRGAIS